MADRFRADRDLVTAIRHMVFPMGRDDGRGPHDHEGRLRSDGSAGAHASRR